MLLNPWHNGYPNGTGAGDRPLLLASSIDASNALGHLEKLAPPTFRDALCGLGKGLKMRR